jgi:cell division protein FtsB
MDQGHSIIWGQLLQLRTPVDDLRRCHPHIADRFTVLSKKLEGAGIGDNFKAASNDLLHQPVSSTSENYHKLADERDRLAQHIRGLDGFDQFLLPRTFSQLQMAARNGPVISINVSKHRCDALILMKI